jgi:hypothetical protein
MKHEYHEGPEALERMAEREEDIPRGLKPRICGGQ